LKGVLPSLEISQRDAKCIPSDNQNRLLMLRFCLWHFQKTNTLADNTPNIIFAAKLHDIECQSRAGRDNFSRLALHSGNEFIFASRIRDHKFILRVAHAQIGFNLIHLQPGANEILSLRPMNSRRGCVSLCVYETQSRRSRAAVTKRMLVDQISDSLLHADGHQTRHHRNNQSLLHIHTH